MRDPGSNNLIVERDGAVALITVNRPRVLNALNLETLEELRGTLHRLGASAEVRCLVITGAGDKAFVAGADISELAELSPAGARDRARLGQSVFDLVEHLGKPVLAAINGYALGGGCELAMACTFRIAADTARLGQPEVNLGLIPGFGGTQRLPRLVGRGHALELLLTGEPITAAEALRLGLVNRVVSAAEVRAETLRVAHVIAAKPATAVRLILEAVREGAQVPLRQAQELEAALFGVSADSEDMREGTRAFLEKRAPLFRGM